MGKTPAKWFKNLLLGKKSSKSNLSKGREVLKPSNKGEQLVSSKLSVTDVNVAAPVISSPLVGTIAGNEVGSENEVAAKLQNDEAIIMNVKEDGSTEATVCSESPEDAEKIKLEKAATKAQAAFRGYAARREFQSFKGLIVLQAHVRGHLVRRQAVSTLCCVKGIVKFQTLVRHHKGAKYSNTIIVGASNEVRRLSKNPFVSNLLASLPTAVPLHLQYDSGEPNSATLWLERWTRSRFWEPFSEQKKKSDSKSHRKHESSRSTETEQDKSKTSVRRLSGAKVEILSVRSASDSEKRNRNPRKVSSLPSNSVQEHSQNETCKVKFSLRKAPDPTKERSDQYEVQNAQLKHRMRKPLGSTAPDISEPEARASDSAEKLKDIEVAAPNQSEFGDLELHKFDNPDDKLHCQSSIGLQPIEIIGKTEDIQELNQQLSCKDDCICNDSQKTRQRRASLPAKFDPQENVVHDTPKLPSYMAPTESAKARLRGQGSPRLSRDVVEKNALLRRHSLSSSTNSMLTSLSPRAHKLVQATGKGVIRGDRSLSSSRDGDKLIQAEWRR
ncbi:protein IQ-DOMAIN 29 [Humulus lupulus]|uniref:protein IQ-DOMAIN 29 n=1 Tax=Humulus lupulus TaxID=3486 RepID=UPI002B403C4D|nr:protein IQ-DOMAIN 29 [Humulus lupulus]XP_062111664.1 protein IQ-DOMAIN 29 [Humulus lupulus]XP_062111665.1 protein IQ-DOMAIN 29 [Humulus lupulus]XP_062111666.1 protein IQ-DOMAIN 29 [Humulus lupulus]